MILRIGSNASMIVAGSQAVALGAVRRAFEASHLGTFARPLCQLMALGAPLGLLAGTQRALADEIEHTRGCLAWLQRSGGQDDTLLSGPWSWRRLNH